MPLSDDVLNVYFRDVLNVFLHGSVPTVLFSKPFLILTC